MQGLLLRFLETGEIQRVGSDDPRQARVDVRVIAATNRNLEQHVNEGRFREDLYYRLQVMPIVIPPLRERRGDVPLLASYYIDTFNREFRKKVRGASADALKVLEGYRWPGNIREMRNAIERAMLLATGDWLQPEDFGGLTRGVGPVQQFQLPPDGVNLEEVERQLLVQALDRAGGNQTHAGQLLGINRDQVRYRIEKFGLHLPNHEKVRHS
jgi:transcriptional regulator with GAF, ATPase, and Fis domain